MINKTTMVLTAALFMVLLPFLSMAETVDLPQTGQTTCYDTAGNVIPCQNTGQDGDWQAGVAWPDPRFTVGTGVEADCVTDNLTGLMWAKNGNLPNGTMTWQGALDYAASLNSGGGFCGHIDWRLPHVNELESLVNIGEADSATWLNGQGFSNVQSLYWSSTTYANSTDSAWDVDVEGGGVGYFNKSSSFPFHVWPVRGTTLPPAQLWKTGQTTSYAAGDDGDLKMGVLWPLPRFMDNGNGTVADKLTGLIWLKDANCFGSQAWTDPQFCQYPEQRRMRAFRQLGRRRLAFA